MRGATLEKAHSGLERGVVVCARFWDNQRVTSLTGFDVHNYGVTSRAVPRFEAAIHTDDVAAVSADPLNLSAVLLGAFNLHPDQ